MDICDNCGRERLFMLHTKMDVLCAPCAVVIGKLDPDEEECIHCKNRIIRVKEAMRRGEEN